MLKFNHVDLSTYGLVVRRLRMPAILYAEAIQLAYQAKAGRSVYPPKHIPLDVQVWGTNMADLMTRLDNIRKALNHNENKELILDVLSDRYWKAMFQNMEGEYIGTRLWKGVLEFICHDPFAYAVNETILPFDIDEDPKTIEITNNGTANALPVYTLTAGENLPTASITIRNNTTGIQLTWEGSITTGQKLAIDCENWYVTLDGNAAMTGMTDPGFPYLMVGANPIIISGFGILGSVEVKFRQRYL